MATIFSNQDFRVEVRSAENALEVKVNDYVILLFEESLIDNPYSVNLADIIRNIEGGIERKLTEEEAEMVSMTLSVDGGLRAFSARKEIITSKRLMEVERSLYMQARDINERYGFGEWVKISFPLNFDCVVEEASVNWSAVGAQSVEVTADFVKALQEVTELVKRFNKFYKGLRII